MDKDIPSLESERLRITAICEEEAEFIHFMRSDPIHNQNVDRSRTKNISEAVDFILARQKENREGSGFFWSIYLKDPIDVIGSICLWNLDPKNKVAELGYDLHPNHQKRGYMREAVARVLKFGFQSLGLHKIVAYTSTFNLASQKVLLNAGFLQTPDILSEEDKAKQLIAYTFVNPES